MTQISFAKGFVNDSQLDRDEVLSVALAITDNALSHWNIKNHLDTVGKRFEKAFINYCDIDRIYLSLDAEATPDSYADFIIRTWDYHISEEDSNALRIDWTFHCMGESSSAEHCDGSHDILIFGSYDGLNENVTNKDQLARLEVAAHSDDGGLSNLPSIRMHELRTTRWYIQWFQAMCDNPVLSGIDEPDDEMRILTIVKNCYKDVDVVFHVGYLRDEILNYIKNYVSTKFQQEWYKNYIGTRKLSFDGPTNYTEKGNITDEDISSMMSGSWDDFLRHRLKIGHTERQDRFTDFMRDYPLEILNWLGNLGLGWNVAIPYYFYEGLAKGGEYELYGCSKEEFIDILNNKDADEQNEDFEYAAVLEEKYGINYAVDYIKALHWYYWYWNGFSYGSAEFILEELYRAISLNDGAELDAEDFAHLGYLAVTRDDGKFGLDFSIEMYSRLAVMWKKKLIGDDWLIDKDWDDGLANAIDWEWGDSNWDESDYPECPDENSYRLWLLKLLESDFANEIADYMKPLLELVLEKEKNHNWENGKKAIESFLAKISNK